MQGQPALATEVRFVDAGVLRVGYHDLGPPEGPVAILLHGFPYDVQSYREVGPALAAEGWRVLIPYLRGYGPTRFLDPATPRSGQQGVLGLDLRAFMDQLDVSSAVLGGYDWGGRAACIVAALWPERVGGLVSVNGYNIQNIAAAARPAAPEDEHRFWYQYYFHTERGRAGLEANRFALGKLLWRLWSPNWDFDDLTYEQSAGSFENPDYVEVVIHSYRHRYGLAAGDPGADAVEVALAEQPAISVPSVCLDGGGDGVLPARGTNHHARFFTGPYRYEAIPAVGHNLPQEAPREFLNAIVSVAEH